MIILGAWTNYRTFIVVVILIANIPIQIPIEPEVKSSFRGLETHRIRGNQRPWRSNRIGDTVSLAIVFVDAIRHEEAQSWQELGR
jgi:hypothetical protein